MCMCFSINYDLSIEHVLTSMGVADLSKTPGFEREYFYISCSIRIVNASFCTFNESKRRLMRSLLSNEWFQHLKCFNHNLFDSNYLTNQKSKKIMKTMLWNNCHKLQTMILRFYSHSDQGDVHCCKTKVWLSNIPSHCNTLAQPCLSQSSWLVVAEIHFFGWLTMRHCPEQHHLAWVELSDGSVLLFIACNENDII